MRAALGRFGTLADWTAFADSWNDLHTDTYMADGGRYRRRRFGVYAAGRQGAIERAAHQAHFQTLDYNHLNGGIERWFEPIEPAISDGASLRTILEYCRALFSRLVPGTDKWHIEVHQFRIEAKPGQAGKPTPEGMHRDGVDYVLVLLIGHDHDPRSRQARAGQLHPDRPARRRAGRRFALLSRRDAGRAGEPGAPRPSRRAGGDVSKEDDLAPSPSLSPYRGRGT